MPECPGRTFKNQMCLGHHFGTLNDAWSDFWDHVRVEPDERGGCWVWVGKTGDDGYGRYQIARSTRGAHRVSYEMINGTVAHGRVLDHLCRNKPCVRPDHLEPVTKAENLLRAIGVEHDDGHPRCSAHHKLTADNTKRFPATGERQCLTCVADVEIKWERSGHLNW